MKKEKKLNLPEIKIPLPSSPKLSMDEYLTFVSFLINHVHKDDKRNLIDTNKYLPFRIR
jgi:hypothetical protein